jgi:hypothetical protein
VRPASCRSYDAISSANGIFPSVAMECPLLHPTLAVPASGVARPQGRRHGDRRSRPPPPPPGLSHHAAFIAVLHVARAGVIEACRAGRRLPAGQASTPLATRQRPRLMTVSRSVFQRVHNPRNRECGCDVDCWCRRTTVGRAVKWWFPAGLFGVHHKSAATAQWKRAQDLTS